MLDLDLEVVHAAWAYVHEHYPTQPWPNRIYLVGDRSAAPVYQAQYQHLVLCTHATGFVWEGEVAWRQECAGCRVEIEGIRELFVAAYAAVTAPNVNR
jgi:hypothetical protein